jgi:hypothetical protein
MEIWLRQLRIQMIVEVKADIQRSETDMINLVEERLKEQFNSFAEKFAKNIEERLQTVTDEQAELKSELKANKDTQVLKGLEDTSKYNYSEDLEALRQELLGKIEEIEGRVGNVKVEEFKDINAETEIKGEEISELAGDLKDDTAVELYVRYLALNKELDTYKQLVISGYKDAQKEIGLNSKCVTYNTRITALEESLKTLHDKKVDVSVMPNKEVPEQLQEVNVESKEVVRMEESKQIRRDPSIVTPIFLDEKKIAEMSDNLGLKVDYLIKEFNNFSLSKADKSSLKKFRNKMNELLEELSQEMKIAKDTIEASSVAHIQLEVDYNKTKKTVNDIEVKVILLLSHSLKNIKSS